MVLSKSELVSALQNEVRILVHLTSKVDRAQLDYRPTPKQRSTFELLKYLSFMGPRLLRFIVSNEVFDPAAWAAVEQAADTRDFDETLAVIASQAEMYATLLADVPEGDFRAELPATGNKATRGAYIVEYVLGGCAAYRMQLFLYLKASGREELGSMNLWAGADQPASV
jgi:hypothetical protein